MAGSIILDDVREFPINQLWETIENLLEETGVSWEELRAVAPACARAIHDRGIVDPKFLALHQAARLFSSLGYELTLTASLIPKNQVTAGASGSDV